MNTPRSCKRILMLLAAAAVVPPVWGHARWVLLSHSVLSGGLPQVVSVDASISNELFYPDLPFGGRPLPESAARPGPQVHLRVDPPEGAPEPVVLWQTARRSIADVPLTEAGTHRVRLEQAPVVIQRYRGADGRTGRVFGPPGRAALPEGAERLETFRYRAAAEAYVSIDGFSPPPVDREGLAVEWLDHPNQAFVGERTCLTVLFDARPLPGVGLLATPEGTRARNARAAVALETDAHGRACIEWPRAGRWLIEVEHAQTAGPDADVDVERRALFVTVEVQPE
ncbi:MAG: hypothetical protein KatS3mg121_1356 [Gammaproteobacteria bacterium]|nr:MAG: hypothetical protein KatS3mg121_1356 [Gammaproteobacteria bacterium]